MLVCKECFADPELISEFTAETTTLGVCEVCNTRHLVLDSSVFWDFFNALLSLFEPANSEKTIADIIQDEWHLFKDIHCAQMLLGDAISNTGHQRYSINDNVDYKLEIRERINIWNKLKTSVKEKSRFFTSMDEFAKYNYLTAGYSLLPGDILYRSRITPAGMKKLKKTQMGCPPKELATAGRANPIGIPYLYLSDTAKTTYFEVRAVYLDKLSVGTFKILQNLKLVDFTYNMNLYLAYNDSSIPIEEYIIKKKIVEAISYDLSKPLRRYDSEIEYVPTQLICEYCKNFYIADGICFESSLHKGGRNIVLFDPTVAKCIKVESHEITKVEIDK